MRHIFGSRRARRPETDTRMIPMLTEDLADYERITRPDTTMSKNRHDALHPHRLQTDELRVCLQFGFAFR